MISMGTALLHVGTVVVSLATFLVSLVITELVSSIEKTAVFGTTVDTSGMVKVSVSVKGTVMVFVSVIVASIGTELTTVGVFLGLVVVFKVTVVVWVSVVEL